MRTANARITSVWIVTLVLTIVSWRLAEADVGYLASAPITLAVLGIGAVKARLIIQEFMDVRAAPWWLRRLTDLWLVALWGAIAGLYLD